MQERYYVTSYGQGTLDWAIIDRNTRCWYRGPYGLLLFSEKLDADRYCEKLNKGENI